MCCRKVQPLSPQTYRQSNKGLLQMLHCCMRSDEVTFDRQSNKQSFVLLSPFFFFSLLLLLLHTRSTANIEFFRFRHCLQFILGRIAVLCMRPIVTDRVAWSVGRSVTLVSPAKTAARIEMPFGLRTRVGPQNNVLHGGPYPQC